MTTRRAVLKATVLGVASAAFPTPARGSSREGDQAAAPAASPRSLIDFHAHWIGPRVVELLKARTNPRPPQGQGWFDIDARLKNLDEAGVQRQVLSYVGAAYDGVMTPDEARPFWRAQNDDLSALVKQHPTRFTGLATLPTANVAAAAEELSRAHQDLGLIGATLPLDAFDLGSTITLTQHKAREALEIEVMDLLAKVETLAADLGKRREAATGDAAARLRALEQRLIGGGGRGRGAAAAEEGQPVPPAPGGGRGAQPVRQRLGGLITAFVGSGARTDTLAPPTATMREVLAQAKADLSAIEKESK